MSLKIASIFHYNVSTEVILSQKLRSVVFVLKNVLIKGHSLSHKLSMHEKVVMSPSRRTQISR